MMTLSSHIDSEGIETYEYEIRTGTSVFLERHPRRAERRRTEQMQL